jgi:hypothetical protein
MVIDGIGAKDAGADETPMSGECWWVILHRGRDGELHHAWYQRALIKGDFKPGLAPRGDYIVDADGRAADPMVTPLCLTCHTIPDVDDLEPFERATGDDGFLIDFRLGRRPWPKPTDPLTCWHCNSHETADPAKVLAATEARRLAARDDAAAKRSGLPLPDRAKAQLGQFVKEDLFLCERCEAHLQREARNR